MVSSGMLCRVALVRTDVSEEPSASFIGVTRIGELGTTLAVTSNRRTLRRIIGISSQHTSVASCSLCCSTSPIFVTLMKEAPGSSETSVLTRATRRNNPEDTILCSLLSSQELSTCTSPEPERTKHRITNGSHCGLVYWRGSPAAPSRRRDLWSHAFELCTTARHMHHRKLSSHLLVHSVAHTTISRIRKEC
jgi:hypothetical protein